MNRIQKLLRSKTFWAGITSIISGTSGLLTDQLPLGDSITLIIAGFGMIFAREAIQKSDDKLESLKPQIENIEAEVRNNQSASIPS